MTWLGEARTKFFQWPYSPTSHHLCPCPHGLVPFPVASSSCASPSWRDRNLSWSAPLGVFFLMRLELQSAFPASRGQYKRWWLRDDSHHIWNMVRVHLIQILIIDVRVGKVKPVEQRLNVPLSANLWEEGFDRCSNGAGSHPSTRSPMLSRWPRKVRQWYCWLVSNSDVFWTHTSARVCWNTQQTSQFNKG